MKHYALLPDGRREVAFDLDRNDQVFGAWVGPAPACPSCGARLTAFCESTQEAPVAVLGSGTEVVICDGCEFIARLEFAA
jgi:hypothetical protein